MKSTANPDGLSLNKTIISTNAITNNTNNTTSTTTSTIIKELLLDNKLTTTTSIPSNQSYLMINTYLHTSSILENNSINNNINNMYIVHINNNPMIACYDRSLCILIN